MAIQEARAITRRGQSVEVLMNEALSPQDYDFLGRDFRDSKVMLARRVSEPKILGYDVGGEEVIGVDSEVKAVAAYRLLPESFHVHTFWADGQMQDSFDAEAISLLVYQLRMTATLAGYPGFSFQFLLPEFAASFVYLQMHFAARPEAIMGFVPGMLQRENRTTPEQRSALAKKAAQARWGKATSAQE